MLINIDDKITRVYSTNLIKPNRIDKFGIWLFPSHPIQNSLLDNTS